MATATSEAMNYPRQLLAAQILFSAIIAIGVATAQIPTVASPSPVQSTGAEPASTSMSTATPGVSASVTATSTATPTTSPSGESPKMGSGDVLSLSILATAGLVICWGVFWLIVWLQDEKITAVLSNPAFFQVVTVMGVIAAAVVLSLSDKLKGELTASILSGIVGYVLGSLTTKQPQQPATQGGTQSGQVTGATGQPQTGPQGTAGAGQGTGTTGQPQTGTQGGTPTDEGAGTTG